MHDTRQSVVVVGAGIFGVTASLELSARGYQVGLVDPGPLPHPLAASTDISKMIRMDYGSDELYMTMMEQAFEAWRVWNAVWGEALFHEDGYLVLAAGELQQGGYEHDSLAMLSRRGHRVHRLDSERLATRFPAWNAERYRDGYYNPVGGWAESGSVVAKLLAQARREGVTFLEERVSGLIAGNGRVLGVRAENGRELRADWVVVAAGAWTPKLLPHLRSVMWPVGQPVLHLRPQDPAAYRPPEYPPWAADIANTGWYGFPALEDGTLKVANHGPGRRIDPDEPRAVSPQEEERFREFLRDSIPSLAEAPLIGSRLCLYCDTFDGNFWIARDPERPGLVVAAGGSGHGFKFAPLLGAITADVLEGRPNPYASRFAWRERGEISVEEARSTE